MVIPNIRELYGHPDEKIRGFGKLASLILVGIGIWMAVKSRAAGSPTCAFGCPFATFLAAGKACWFAALVVLAGSIFAPCLIRPFYILLSFVGMCVGFVLGHVVLTLTYLTLFVLIGRLRRATSPVTKRFEPSVPTYWTKRGPAKSLDRYYRQY
jgi:hypothetical protein